MEHAGMGTRLGRAGRRREAVDGRCLGAAAALAAGAGTWFGAVGQAWAQNTVKKAFEAGRESTLGVVPFIEAVAIGGGILAIVVGLFAGVRAARQPNSSWMPVVVLIVVGGLLAVSPGVVGVAQDFFGLTGATGTEVPTLLQGN